MCILLVEDDWLIRTMVAEALTDAGFAVCEAEDGDHASDLILRDPTFFTLLVTDIHMPGSLDGLGVARLMRVQRPDMPLIYTTGRTDVLRHLQPFGTNEVVLQKPFMLFDLVTAVRLLLNHQDPDLPLFPMSGMSDKRR